MEQIFEDFVAHCFRKHQNEFDVKTQGPKKYLVTDDNKKPAFQMKPDITLENNQSVRFILDTKWKRINEGNTYSKRGISQADMYQLYAYGKKYECNTVALIYPQTQYFKEQIPYRFDDKLRLLCFPFDVVRPEFSIKSIIDQITQ